MVSYHPASHTSPYEAASPVSLFTPAFEIEPVALVYKDGTRNTIDVHNNACRLMRTLDRIGRERIHLVNVFSPAASFDRSSIIALELYLHTMGGLSKFRDAVYPVGGWHRWGWVELQRHLNLRWTRSG